MNEVLSLATLALGVLCFVAFVTTVKPTAISAIQAAPDYCRTDPFGMRDATCMSSQQCHASSGSPRLLGAARDTTTARSRGTCPDESRVKRLATSS